MEKGEPDNVARPAYDAVIEELKPLGVQGGAMFGMPALKADGKAFAGLAGTAMVFKLRGPEHARALELPGTHLFDPSGMGRPMKEWVVVPLELADRWQDLATAALGVLRGA